MDDLIYKKLFKIHYNNKEFQLFCDPYFRITFLEIKNNKYNYPLIDDFIHLNKIYNFKNPFVCYDGERLNDKKSFKEFVKFLVGNTSFLLAVVCGANVITTATMGNRFDVRIENNKIKFDVVSVDDYLIKNTSELDSILGYDNVSLDEIKSVIDMNENMDEVYKNYSFMLASFLKNKYPLTDQRIFYDNLKSIEFKPLNESLFYNVVGTYSSLDNTISFKEGFVDDKEVILHEFAHSYHHWKENKLLFSKHRTEVFGSSLDEAMTNKIIGDIIEVHTYKREGRILDYLLSCVDYSYYHYEREGIIKLINLLKEKYPFIDIDYLITYIDSMSDTLIFNDEYINIEENENIMDLFFEICKSNIKMEKLNYYQSFIDFIKLIDYFKYEDLISKYLEKYNEYLINNGVDEEYIINDYDEILTFVRIFKSCKTDFKDYLVDFDFCKIDKDNIYSEFYSYLSSSTILNGSFISYDEMYNYFCDMLDIYNNYLFLNGYTREDVITREDIESKFSKYKDINVIGYLIDQDDMLYPIIDINEKFDNRIVCINYEGKYVLYNKEDVKLFSYFNSNLSYQYKFLSKLFSNIESDNIVFGQEFWEEFVNKESYEYKKIDVFYDGKKLCEDYIYSLRVKVGQKEDGTNTFGLYSYDNVIFDDEECVKYQFINLTDYIMDDLFKLGNVTSIDLKDYLNFNYLRNKIAGSDLSDTCSIYYSQFTYNKENDVIDVHRSFYVNIDDLNIRTTLNRVMLDIGPGYADIWYNGIIDSAKSYVSVDVSIKDTIYLETVLDYYGYLDAGLHDITLSSDQILELYGMYVNDSYINNMRNSR